MSGGHFNWIQTNMEYELVGHMLDPELDDLMKDVVELVNDLDLYLSDDTSEKDWEAAKEKFKRKWLRGNHEERLKKLVEEKINQLKDELIQTIECGTSKG